MSANYILGMKALLLYGEPGDSLSELVEAGNVKDVTISGDAGEADVTTRRNNGFRATAATLKEFTIETELQVITGEPFYDAVRAAWLASSEIRLATLTEEDGDGFMGDFTVTGFQNAQPLEESQTVSVTFKISSPPVVIEAGSTA
jgi:hypothetical protein